MSIMAGALLIPSIMWGATQEDLQSKINAKNTDIQQLEREIALYQQQAEVAAKNAKTLQGAVSVLTLTQRKLQKEIDLTQTKIDRANYELESLTGTIGVTKAMIDRDHRMLTQTLRLVNDADRVSLIEIIFSGQSIAQISAHTAAIDQLQQNIVVRASKLKNDTLSLQQQKGETLARQGELAGYQAQIKDQKTIVASNKNQQSKLLSTTKNSESKYRNIVAQKLALKEAFEQELRTYEAQLHATIDSTKLPMRGSGVLSWPLKNIFVTQFFGDTEFSRTGTYNGNGHNGVDFKALMGTPVYADGDGVVDGAGDTDIVCPRASFGKWIFIRHSNGLATTYGHLSLIKVVAGQQVSAGDLIGYSGNTGYSTGPHLHVSVYASQAVSVQSRPSKVCNGIYTMPIAPLNAYLNPMDYFPSLSNAQ
ncbi:MAG: murein hydrolase activator EnvC family protein [Minisyncoccota bacterium]